MDIKGEASVFKAEVANNLKQLSENAEVVIGKKIENNTAEIKIEDKSKHSTLNLNFIFVGSVSPQQVEDITKRVKDLIGRQAEVVEASGDKQFEPYVSQGIGTYSVASGTASAVLMKNADYIFKGESEPVFVRAPGALPISVTVVQPKVITDK